MTYPTNRAWEENVLACRDVVVVMIDEAVVAADPLLEGRLVIRRLERIGRGWIIVKPTVPLLACKVIRADANGHSRHTPCTHGGHGWCAVAASVCSKTWCGVAKCSKEPVTHMRPTHSAGCGHVLILPNHPARPLCSHHSKSPRECRRIVVFEIAGTCLSCHYADTK